MKPAKQDLKKGLILQHEMYYHPSVLIKAILLLNRKCPFKWNLLVIRENSETSLYHCWSEDTIINNFIFIGES